MLLSDRTFAVGPRKMTEKLGRGGLTSKIKLNYSFSPYRAVNTPSVIQNNQLMLCGEIIAVCSQIHTKHINTLCRQNVELLNVKLAVHIVTSGGTYSDHCAIKS
jgi:hypothetical protein